VVLSMLKTVQHHTLDVAQMGFLQVCGQIIESTICIHTFRAKFMETNLSSAMVKSLRIKSHCL
jgi:hypothetical protein